MQEQIMSDKRDKAKRLLLNKPCEYCGNPEAIYREDPYNSEILNDYTKHWICDICYQEQLNEI